MRSLILLTLTAIFASACAPIPVKDNTFYGDEGKFGAVEAHTLFTTIPPMQIDKPTWDDLRIGMACTAANNIADLMSIIDKLCSKHPGECVYETQQRILKAKTGFYGMLAAMKKKGVNIDDDMMKVFWTPEGEALELP